MYYLAMVYIGELYICGCGGSDYVSGDRLRQGGDCDSADKIREDPLRVAAASKSFASMTSFSSKQGGSPSPDVVQVKDRTIATF
jgi:hypothetical protein